MTFTKHPRSRVMWMIQWRPVRLSATSQQRLFFGNLTACVLLSNGLSAEFVYCCAGFTIFSRRCKSHCTLRRLCQSLIII